jgi:ribosome-associated protein
MTLSGSGIVYAEWGIRKWGEGRWPSRNGLRRVREARTAVGISRPSSPVAAHTDRMLGPLRVSRSILVPERELRWRFSRSSGPGGQSVNTADSRAELSLDLATTTALGPVQRTRAMERLAGRLVDGVLTVAAEGERSQLRNREAARARLAEILSEAVAPPPPRRRPTRPSRAAVERRLADKRRRAKTKRLRRADDD